MSVSLYFSNNADLSDVRFGDVSEEMFANGAWAEVVENGDPIGTINSFEEFKLFMDFFEAAIVAVERRQWMSLEELSKALATHGRLPTAAAIAMADLSHHQVTIRVPESKPQHLTIQAMRGPLVFKPAPFTMFASPQYHGLITRGFYLWVKDENGVTQAVIRDADDLQAFMSKQAEAFRKDLDKCLELKQSVHNDAYNELVSSMNVCEEHPLPTADDKVKAAVNPSHYKGYVEEMQWLDTMSRIPSLRKPERFIAAVELQVRKYMDRNEQKDAPVQEFSKANFYLTYIVLYMRNGCKPVKAEDVHAVLSEMDKYVNN